jgi:hypothetical protein
MPNSSVTSFTKAAFLLRKFSTGNGKSLSFHRDRAVEVNTNAKATGIASPSAPNVCGKMNFFGLNCCLHYHRLQIRPSGVHILFDTVSCRQSVLGLVMSTISKRNDKPVDIEAYYRNESKTFWFGPLTVGTKAKHIDLFKKNF